jgi:glycine cleavage system aminomethyltransferase T
MTDLAFLSVVDVSPSAAFRPLARSSMERRLRDAGASFEQRAGWLVATHVPGEEQLRLQVRDVTHAVTVRESADGVSVELAGGDAARPVWTGELWYGGERPPGCAPVDVTAGYAALELEGVGATTVLRRLTDLDLEELPAVGALAHVRVFVFREREELYRLVFPQEYGHYLWEVVVDAAHPLAGGPAGAPS